MTISTMEQLAGLSPGTTIQVGPATTSNEWVRVEGGFQQGEFTIAVEKFAGDVTQNRVRQVVSWAVGMWARDGNDHYYLIEQQDNGGWITCRVRGALYYGLALFNGPPPGEPIDGPVWEPSEKESLASVVQQHLITYKAMVDASTQRDAAVQEREQAVTEVTNYKMLVERTLHPLYDRDKVSEADMDEALHALGVRKPDPKETVTVMVHGRSIVTLDAEAVAHLVPGTTIRETGTQVYADWDKEVKVTFRCPEDRHPCGRVTRPMILQALADEGITNISTFSTEVQTCTRHTT